MSLVYTYENNPNGAILTHMKYIICHDGCLHLEVSSDGIHWIDIDLTDLEIEWNDFTHSISSSNQPE